ncbi:hypothetical protein EDEG_03543 [Edhazardia aedis USNM 41457]|uniref:Uncharacterized protein n=1 Tax=Edhazardia aedis (strain USNM 41457) TaxID=1003232 RepID=J9D2D8_EDHAE|nr:hypothetical protein EDEG_03543 [Edhazardia aedis USNM 41457]|eukprot:EJW02001.1 hypothetical protein EDEG_03543 [Edhazardia aedis USNM 41457]
MIYINGDGTDKFYTNKKITKQIIECSITETFNIHLYSNVCAFTESIEDVVFLVPVHLPSFAAKFMNFYDKTLVESMFDFKTKEQKNKFLDFVDDITDTKIRKIALFE